MTLDAVLGFETFRRLAVCHRRTAIRLSADMLFSLSMAKVCERERSPGKHITSWTEHCQLKWKKKLYPSIPCLPLPSVSCVSAIGLRRHWKHRVSGEREATVIKIRCPICINTLSIFANTNRLTKFWNRAEASKNFLPPCTHLHCLDSDCLFNSCCCRHILLHISTSVPLAG